VNNLRIFVADLLLRLSLWVRPADCIAGTGWAALPEYKEMK